MISELLNSKTIGITGATGFLGTALIERLLRAAPHVNIVCVVRPTRLHSPLQRIQREVLRNDCFQRLRDEHGAQFDEHVASRVRAIAGDVGTDNLGLREEDLRIFGECDVVIHAAATVSFDSPLDTAVEINLLGPSRVASALRAAHSHAHFIAVSTAYVSGSRRGAAPEELVTDAWYSPDVKWEDEVVEARRARADAEHNSRQIAQLAVFQKQAREELGNAGTPLLAQRAEKLRMEWVQKQLVNMGQARSTSLGWPDVYAFTKALGERALLATRGDVPVTFVRPSIIESAYNEPHPGWIRGFRMAEPILLGVGKGILKSFPGLPEGVLDVIPVDKVVALLCAVAALPAPETPQVLQIASGTRQPLRYRDLVDLVTEYYRAHPLYDANNNPIAVFTWNYPRRRKVQRQLTIASKTLTAAHRALSLMPLRRRTAELAARLEEKRDEADRALGYVEIYGAYTESEARFDISKTLNLFTTLDDDDKKQFDFDPIDIDWRHYLHNIHLPSVIAQGRVKTAPSTTASYDRFARARNALLQPERKLAVFDLEHTLIPSTVIGAYIRFVTKGLSPAQIAELFARRLPLAPGLFLIDRQDRSEFQRMFYRWYAGISEEEFQARAQEVVEQYILPRMFAQGLARVQAHRAAGHRTLLLTGTLEVYARGLQPYFDDIVATTLVVEHGKTTGEIVASPPVGEARALLLRDYAQQYELDLSQAVAYADSTSDLPMLEAVGYPVAVNPETRLAGIARRRGWLIEHWQHSERGKHNERCEEK